MSDEIDEVEEAIQRLAQTREEDQLPPGTVVAGRFVVGRRPGMGAMGAVYLATQKSMGREVALKTLQPHYLRDEHLLRRFYLEAKAASKLDHPNIVKIYDFGIDEDLKIPFIAMEYLTGDDLGDFIHNKGPFSETEACELLSQVAKALVEAHDKGIVHRDLKPDNIHVRRLSDGDRQCKVLDFGIAKVVEGASESEANLTGTGMSIGTPLYMSPEQVCGRPVDFRADLYALGCVLYELVAGRLPFPGGETQERMKVLLAHLNDPIPDLPDTLADGRAPTDALRQTVACLLAKTPDERPASTSGVARALGALGRGEPVDVAVLLSTANASHHAPASGAETVMSTMEAPGLSDGAASPSADGLGTNETAAFVAESVSPAGFGTDETAAFVAPPESATQKAATRVPESAPADEFGTNETAAFVAPPESAATTSDAPPASESATEVEASAPEAAVQQSESPTTIDPAPTAAETDISTDPTPAESARGGGGGVWIAFAALLLAGGIGWAALGGFDDAPSKPDEVAAPASTEPTTPAPVAEAAPSKKPAAAPSKKPAAAAPSKKPAADPRSPPPARPAPKASKGPTMGGAKVRTGALSSQEARRIMGRASGKLKSCFKASKLTERVLVRVLVGGGGAVKSVSVKPRSAGAFKSCVSPAIRALQFPKTPGTGFSTVEVAVRP